MSSNAAALPARSATGRPAARKAAGGARALAAASLAAVWERVAFGGLLNFSSDDRTTALFWEMHVGGAALDGFLALTLPFALLATLGAGRLRRARGLGLPDDLLTRGLPRHPDRHRRLRAAAHRLGPDAADADAGPARRGLAGVGLIAVLLVGGLWRLSVGQARRHPLAPALAAGLCGFVVVGLFDSLLDVPRVALLFYLLVFIALSLPADARATPAGR